MRTAVTLSIIIVASVSLARAQAAPAAPPRAAQVTLDVGFVSASGNSDFTSANAGDKLTWRLGEVLLTQTGKVIYGKTKGAVTSESYDFGARGEYKLTSRIGVFVLGQFQRDPFAGLSARWSVGPGVAIGLVRTARDTLDVEAAVTSQRERSTAGVEQSFGASRTAALFKHSLTSTAFVSEGLEWIANLKTSDDYRVNSETALTAPLSKQIALRVSYLIRFDNQPEPGFEKTDRILTTGVQISL